MRYADSFYFFLIVATSLCALVSCDQPPKPKAKKLTLQSLSIGLFQVDIQTGAQNAGAPNDKSVNATFNASLDPATVEQAVTLKMKSSSEEVPLTFSFFENNRVFCAQPSIELRNNESYTFSISEKLQGKLGEQFEAITIDFVTAAGTLEITSLLIDGNSALNSLTIKDVPVAGSLIEISFSEPLRESTVNSQVIRLEAGTQTIPLTLSLSDGKTKLTIGSDQKLQDLKEHLLLVSSELQGENGELFQTYDRNFYTAADPAPDFPPVSDEALLTLVQQQTFKYFWDFAHPASGMARERNTSGNIVTSGGSGFGIMSIIVAIERNFITRQEGLERLDKILDFLETADRFHGAWSHWINGNSGDVVPFSINDNGGDLVETSFLIQGLITFRQYLNDASPAESALINRINSLWEAVEWDWYTRGGQNVLYWHWSPDKEWAMNHPIRGYNECLITYLLAASSSTHPITPVVYQSGWAGNGTMANGKSFYSIPLPLGSDYGGPLFFAHYSFLGLDPRNLTDTYASYWTQNVNHSRINHAHSMANPKKFIGYSDHNWGLTASDNHQGYSAHSPVNDLGVISPTAALSSFPYTPDESMKALNFFYYTLGDRLWGQYGFYDAFNLTEGWTADSYLAIDQGPVIVMIENYRTGLLWNLFMSAPEVQAGLNSLSFTY